ncbi:cytochrome P450 [Lentithecium fluviatile CBS 122367]|uniref:Cytochrome P450 n=1 Tax=Lentithecium fluviatile CBS 122367 TaxID=1168545 RepID=A0A6G1IMF2_9PLEO|nr:cytochrome P450 [Lentithecium fluviatile CBS 122367]
MNGIPAVPFLLGISIVTFIAVSLDRLLRVKKNASEPPFVPMSVPYFGHMLGVIGEQANYYQKMGKKCGQKVFSLAMPGGRIYIVNSPDYISTIQKVPRVLSFWFIEASLTKNLGGISKKANDILLDNARGDKGNNSLVVDGMKATHAAMAGRHLGSLTLNAIQRANREVNEYAKPGQEVELWDWVQHIFSLAVSSSVYGPDNPYEDEKLERGLSTFSDYTPQFLSGLPPWLIIPKGYAAREALVSQFEKYFAEKSDSTGGSELVKARAKILREYGIPEPDIARFEVVNGFGILLNLLPSAFWTIHHIFSDPQLLEVIRQEAKEAGLLESPDGFPSSEEELDKLSNLPLLTSALKEAMRMHAAGAAARMVMEDHMLDGKYFLKRNSYVLIPNKAAHFDKSAWGNSADEFMANRFDKSSGEKIHPAAFRGFGGGVNLCPGRAFSIKLITSVVASLALRYDIQAGGKGKWDYPEHDESNITINLARPLKKTFVQFVRRAV